MYNVEHENDDGHVRVELMWRLDDRSEGKRSLIWSCDISTTHRKKTLGSQ